MLTRHIPTSCLLGMPPFCQRSTFNFSECILLPIYSVLNGSYLNLVRHNITIENDQHRSGSPFCMPYLQFVYARLSSFLTTIPNSVADQRAPRRRRQDLKARLVSECLPSFRDSLGFPLWVNDYVYRHLSAGEFDFEDYGLLDLDDMDSREASNSTLKSANHQFDVDDILGMPCKPVEVDRVNTREEVCVFIFICFCSFFEARSAHISLQTYYYLRERLIAVTSILPPGQTVQTGFSVPPARLHMDTTKN